MSFMTSLKVPDSDDDGNKSFQTQVVWWENVQHTFVSFNTAEQTFVR